MERSPDATLFARAEYLEATGRKIAYFQVIKGGEPRAGVYLVLDETDSEKTDFDDLVIYSGLVLFPPSGNEGNQTILSKRFEITEFVISELALKFKKIMMALAPSLNDIRPFLWHNYHEADAAKKFSIRIRYTTLVNIESIRGNSDEQACLAYEEMSSSRRQEIRYARKDGISASEKGSVADLIRLYRATFAKQNAEMAEVDARCRRIEALASNLLEINLAKLFVVNNKEGKAVSAALFGLHGKNAYYLFGGNDPEHIDRYSGTIVIWDAFKALSQVGITMVDLEGVNSPARGWFKLSFGGTLNPYYHCILDPGK